MRFRFRPPFTDPPKTAVEPDIPEQAFDWSETELDALSEVSQEDLDDTSNWLRRIGHEDAAKLFDAETE